MNKTSFFPILFLLFFVHYGIAQEVISSSGSSFENSSARLSWTLGEPVIETFTAGQSVLTQGFQQSKLTVTAINQISDNSIRIKVYPNPVTSQLTVEAGENEKYNFSLIDLNGKVLVKREVKEIVETVDMQIFTPGSYFLTVFSSNGKQFQTFKVIKSE
jgi:hypothetical protein